MAYRISKHVVFSLSTLALGTAAAAFAASCAENDKGEPLGMVRASQIATINPTIIATPTLTIVKNPCVFADCAADTNPCTYHCRVVDGKAACGTYDVECAERTCEAGSCDRNTGECVYRPTTDVCTDGDPCTTNDRCSERGCIGTPLGCDDNNACTTDTCKEGNCVWDPVETGTSCNDQNGCTDNDECTAAGVCVGSGGPDCDDGNPCTTNQCANNSCDWSHLEDVGTPCLHENKCLVNTTCNASGECTSDEEKNCDDGNPCTKDSCDPESGCVNEPDNEATCTDGNVCTVNDACVDGLCTPESGISCAPIDDCHEAGECDPLNGLCSDPRKPDGETCENTGTCTGGRCEGGTPDPEGGAGGGGSVGEAGASSGGDPGSGEGGAPPVAAGGEGGDEAAEGGEDAGGAPASSGGRGVIAPAEGGDEGDDDKGKQVFKREPGGCTVNGASVPAEPGLVGALALAGLALMGLRRKRNR